MKYVDSEEDLLFSPFKVVFESNMTNPFKIGFHLPTLDELQKFHTEEGGLYLHARNFHECALCTINKINESDAIPEDRRLPTCRSFKCSHFYHPYCLDYWIKRKKGF